MPVWWQHNEVWCLKVTPEAHWLDAGDPCRVQSHHCAVRYYDGGFGSVGCDYSVDGSGESLKRLLRCLIAQHKFLRIEEELLDSLFKLILRGKVRHVASVVFFQSVNNLYWDIQRIGEYLRGFYRLWLFAAPD